MKTLTLCCYLCIILLLFKKNNYLLLFFNNNSFTLPEQNLNAIFRQLSLFLCSSIFLLLCVASSLLFTEIIC